jgi:enamine deaminase RidA (YjgF/YER057c/UK114 family)
MIHRSWQGLWFPLLTAAVALGSAAQTGAAQQQAGPPTEVRFYGSPQSPISGGVALPAGAMVWTSGTVAPPANQAAPADSRERFGDTRTQAVAILRSIEQQLQSQGLTMRDVVYLRAYLTPDPENNGVPDWRGWNEAYGQFFANDANPTRTARSTVGVSHLINPLWLIEIEAFAAYPASR